MALEHLPSQFASDRSGSRRDSDPVDTMLARYIAWRSDERAVSQTYECWRDASAAQADRRFVTYLTALDREEVSARGYAVAVADVERFLGIG